MKILIAEDDPVSMELLHYALQQRGHEVVRAKNGTEAFQQVVNHGIRLVISDWQMPEMSGIEFTRKVRSTLLDGYVYIILLTSRGKKSDIIEGLEAGADEFLVKPFDAAELAVRLRAAERILSQDARDLTILALATLAESRDADTGAHLERVQRYCKLLALTLAKNPKFAQTVTPDFVALVHDTCPLHDIGKVGVPDSVLFKPARLTEAEYEIMKVHTQIGARTIDAVLQRRPNTAFLRMARDVAAYHHERFDGKGYPFGLAGDNIPLCARIVAVADVYDALTSKRVYKVAMSHQEARTIIVESRGTHFDPDIVDAFLKIEDEIAVIRRTVQTDQSQALPLDRVA